MSKSFRRSSYQRASDVTDDTHRAATEHALAEQIALATSWAVHIRAAAQLCDRTLGRIRRFVTRCFISAHNTPDCPRQGKAGRRGSRGLHSLSRRGAGRCLPPDQALDGPPLRAIASRNPEWALAPDRRSAMIEWTGADAMWIMVAGRYRTGGVDAAKRTENLLVPNAT